MTNTEHLDRITQQISQYQQSTGISPDIILISLDFVNLHVWKIISPTRKNDFRKSVVMSDRARLPADWILWAGSAAYTDTVPKVRESHYVHPEQLGYTLTNTFEKATTAFPAVYFEDGLFKTVPAGLTNFLVWYFNRPTSMYGAAPDTDDGMPDWTTPLVHKETARALLELSDDEKKSAETLIKRQAESLALNEKFFPVLREAMLNAAPQVVKPQR